MYQLMPTSTNEITNILSNSSSCSMYILTIEPFFFLSDEPYSPEDSDPDTVVPPTDPAKDTTPTEEIPLLTAPAKTTSFLDSNLNTTQTFEPFANKFDTIPGLEDTALPSSSQELQKKMEELDQRIAMQKAEIDNMSQDIVSSATASADIESGALANISLPSNLQQILDNIKTIGTAISVDSQDSQVRSLICLCYM